MIPSASIHFTSKQLSIMLHTLTQHIVTSWETKATPAWVLPACLMEERSQGLSPSRFLKDIVRSRCSIKDSAHIPLTGSAHKCQARTFLFTPSGSSVRIPRSLSSDLSRDRVKPLARLWATASRLLVGHVQI